MTHWSTESRRGVAAGHVVIGVFGVLFLYALSIGPAVWIVQSRSTSGSTLRQVYAPLIWTCAHTPLRYPMGWYLDLWDPD